MIIIIMIITTMIVLIMIRFGFPMRWKQEQIARLARDSAPAKRSYCFVIVHVL